MGNVLTQEIQLAKGVLGELISLLCRGGELPDSLFDVFRDAVALEQELAQLVLGKLVPQSCRFLEPPAGGSGVSDLQVQLSKGVHGVLMPLFRCLGKPDHRLDGVGFHRPAIPVQFSEGILCVLRTSLREFRQPFYGLRNFLRRGTDAVQDQLCQLVLGVFISGPRGFLKPLPGGGFLALRPDAVQEHPAKTVLELIVVALMLQKLKAAKGGDEIAGGPALVRPAANTITIKLSQLPGCVREIFDRRLFIELERSFVTLLHAPALTVQLGKGVLCVGVVLFC